MIESQLLPHLHGYIAGRWSTAESGQTFSVIDPATGAHLADVPDMGARETMAAIEAASAALRHEQPVEERKRWLLEIERLIIEHKDELARIITLEQGKSLKESHVEVDYTAGFFRYFAAQLSHLAPHTLSQRIRDCQWKVHHRPAGVVGLITPWNFPLALLAKKLAPAIGAGCSVVAKPARMTPLSAIAFWTLAERLDLPPGKLNLVLGSAGPIGDCFATHPAVRVISFTGSTEVGKRLAKSTSAHVKRLTMELGGNAPLIVFEDADLETAASALIANKFRTAGQTCVCANRVYVQRKLADRFTDLVAQRVEALRVGNGIDPATDIGPLVNREGFDKVAAHVRDALARGAKRIVGGDPPRPAHDWGCFYPPTVLTGVTPEMLVCQEETFGPVVAISLFDDEDQAIQAANATPFGLAAYVFTRDANRAQRVTFHLQFGHVGLNTATGPTPEAPFGGMKQSGYGREGGLEGLLEYCETQTVASA